MALMTDNDLQLIRHRLNDNRNKNISNYRPLKYFIDKYRKSGFLSNLDEFEATIINKMYTSPNITGLSGKELEFASKLIDALYSLELRELLDSDKYRLGSVLGMPIYKSNLPAEFEKFRTGRSVSFGAVHGHWKNNSNEYILVEPSTLKLPDFMIDYIILHEIGHSVDNIDIFTASDKQLTRIENELKADLFAANWIGYENAINGRKLVSDRTTNPLYKDLVDKLTNKMNELKSLGKSIDRKIDVSSKFWKL